MGLLGFIQSNAQVSFTDGTSDLNDTSLTSGVSMAIVDMNNDGLDDIIRLSNASNLRIEFQQADGSFNKLTIGNVSSVWGMTIADVDANGYNDIIVGGAYNGLKLAKANATGTAYTVSTLTGPNIFLQNANFADIDNDGAIDFFGCHDDGISSPYKNDGAGNLTYDLGLISATSTVPSDNSGNYGSIWTDYDNDGDLDMYLSKCRLGVTNTGDGRRRNMLFQNDGSNNFTDVAPAAGLLPLDQTWATIFEDIDNDGDLDAVMVNHENSSSIYRNNGNGTFTDITASSGVATEIAATGIGIQVMMEDFDNDTFIDIIITTRSGDHYLFYNDGDLTFTAASPFSTTGDRTIQSGAVGDVNNDGFVDFLAGYATGFNSPSSTADQLFINGGNSNNWSKVTFEGTFSNSNGIGARVELHGDWGTQIREVRAGESYGTQNTFTAHFGIADATAITKLVVKWPSGIVDEIINPGINQRIHMVEGQNAICEKTSTWDGMVWDNGEPDNNTIAIIDGDYTVDAMAQAPINACSVVINMGHTLTITAGETLHTLSNIIVDGTLEVQNKASVVQFSDMATVTKNGTILVHKSTPSLEGTDFIIMGSPMTAETTDGVLTAAFNTRQHIPANFIPHPDIAAASPGAENFADDNGNNWALYNGTLNPGEGFFVKPQHDDDSASPYTIAYTLGTLNNGIVSVPITYNGSQIGSPNILANPYASAIDADIFIASNAMIDALYFWEHLTAPSSSYPGFYASNFDMGDISVYNAGSGGLAAGNGGNAPTRYIASGQGFGIKASAGGTAIFTNRMRVNGQNDSFRQAVPTPTEEKERIWLEVSNESYGLRSAMLVAFTEGATDGFESHYDTKRLATPISLYSTLEGGKELAIQGRTAFQEDQVVPLAFQSQVEEEQEYSISIQQLEGIQITASPVYLEDRLLGRTTNLLEENYTFTAHYGIQSDRFVLRFKPSEVLGLNDASFNNAFTVYPNPTINEINIKSTIISEPTTVQVYDLSGRMVLQKALAAQENNRIQIGHLDAGIYLLKIGQQLIKMLKN